MSEDVTKRTVELAPGDRVDLHHEPRTVAAVEPLERLSAIADPATHRVIWEGGGRTLARAGDFWLIVTPETEERWLNEAAELLPQDRVDEPPTIIVGGARVSAWWENGVLRVSVATGDVQPPQVAVEGGLPAIRVDVHEGTAWSCVAWPVEP